MKISFLVFLVSAILLALFASTGDAKRVPIRKPTNLGAFSNSIRNSIRRPNLRKIVKPTLPGLI